MSTNVSFSPSSLTVHRSLPTSVDLSKDTVLAGRVLDVSGQAVGGASVELLDTHGEFTAGLTASDTGDFRFFVAPGHWTVRALSSAGAGATPITPTGAGLHEVDITVTRPADPGGH